MNVRPLTDWLGVRQRPLSIGLHLSDEHISVVAIRPHPVRVVAVGRDLVYDGAIVDGDVRLTAAIAPRLRAIVDELGLDHTVPVVVALEPSENELAFDLDGTASIAATLGAIERITETIARAGLRLAGLDTTPTALARVAGSFGADAVTVDGGGRWWVNLDRGRVDAWRTRRATGRHTIHAGPSPDRIAAVDRLPGVIVPRRIRAHVDPGRDAVALGAALAALGRGPAIDVRPEQTTTTARWVARPVPDPILAATAGSSS